MAYYSYRRSSGSQDRRLIYSIWLYRYSSYLLLSILLLHYRHPFHQQVRFARPRRRRRHFSPDKSAVTHCTFTARPRIARTHILFETVPCFLSVICILTATSSCLDTHLIAIIACATPGKRNLVISWKFIYLLHWHMYSYCCILLWNLLRR